MKKKLIIFCAVVIGLGLTGFGVINWNNTETGASNTALNNVEVNKVIVKEKPVVDKTKKRVFTDFVYGIGPRYSGIRKGVVFEAKTIDAFFDEEQLQRIETLKSVEVIRVVNNKRTNTREMGYDRTFTEAQQKMLRDALYSYHFVVRAEFEQYNSDTGVLEVIYSSPHYTIVPESQARYADGKRALITFIKEKVNEITAPVDPDKLQPAKLIFTVSKYGNIENVKLDRPTGYPEVDETMIELISKTPGKWVPAKNAYGEYVDMELVVSFGLAGC